MTEKPVARWKRALVQGAFAGVFIVLAFFSIGLLQGRLAMASLAASAFIAFSFAQSESARPRQLVGGYACGVLWGGIACLVRNALPTPIGGRQAVIILFCAAAVGLCGLFMNLLRVQHPPSAALALAMVLERHPIAIGLATMGCILVLCGLRWLALRLFAPYLESL